MRGSAKKALIESKHFTPTADIWEMSKMAEDVVSIGNQTGEGWFLTGEMLHLIHDGVPNIVCTQPFACLPNHIVGKGVIKKLRAPHPSPLSAYRGFFGCKHFSKANEFLKANGVEPIDWQIENI